MRAGIFQRAQKFGTAVFEARHPAVQKYLADAVLALRPWLQRRQLEKVALVICTEQMRPLERFVFEIAPAGDRATLQPEHLQAYLRSFFIKINTAEAAMTPNVEGQTFSIVAYTANDALSSLPSADDALLWEPVDEDSVAPAQRRLMPLRSMNEGPLRVQLVVEHVVHDGEDAML